MASSSQQPGGHDPDVPRAKRLRSNTKPGQISLEESSAASQYPSDWKVFTYLRAPPSACFDNDGRLTPVIRGMCGIVATDRLKVLTKLVNLFDISDVANRFQPSYLKWLQGTDDRNFSNRNVLDENIRLWFEDRRFPSWLRLRRLRVININENNPFSERDLVREIVATLVNPPLHWFYVSDNANEASAADDEATHAEDAKFRRMEYIAANGGSPMSLPFEEQSGNTLENPLTSGESLKPKLKLYVGPLKWVWVAKYLHDAASTVGIDSQARTLYVEILGKCKAWSESNKKPDASRIIDDLMICAQDAEAKSKEEARGMNTNINFDKVYDTSKHALHSSFSLGPNELPLPSDEEIFKVLQNPPPGCFVTPDKTRHEDELYNHLHLDDRYKMLPWWYHDKLKVDSEFNLPRTDQEMRFRARRRFERRPAFEKLWPETHIAHEDDKAEFATALGHFYRDAEGDFRAEGPTLEDFYEGLNGRYGDGQNPIQDNRPGSFNNPIVEIDSE